MYLRKVHIENIRSIAKLDWEIPEGKEAGWHVVIGDNGSGKSTFLRAVALALVGMPEAMALALLQNWSDWLRQNEQQGRIKIQLNSDPKLVSQMELNKEFNSVLLEDEGIGSLLVNIEFSYPENNRFLSPTQDIDFSTFTHPRLKTDIPPIHNLIGFSAAYGPFRRFTGGDQESEKSFQYNPRLSAHLSIFHEKFALTECLQWLKELKFKQLEQKPEGGLLENVMAFINQEDFLPHQAQLTEISSDGVIFTDGDGQQISIEELSDGYRSILSLTFELIRQMSNHFQIDKIFSADSSTILASGIVLIDEVDAHLHPTWQRRIGLWFREHFPNIQFIVTTHSPLVCQAAEHGTVFRLPAPGSEEQAGMVDGIALQRLLYGDVLDAYGTALFGEDVGRSEKGKEMMQELAELNVKEVNFGLNKIERAKQQKLRAAFPTMPYRPLVETSEPAINGQRKEKRK